MTDHRLKYETKAGNLDESATYLQLIEHLRLAAEGAYMLGHFRKANDDQLTGTGFLGIGQLLEKAANTVTELATGKLRH